MTDYRLTQSEHTVLEAVEDAEIYYSRAERAILRRLRVRDFLHETGDGFTITDPGIEALRTAHAGPSDGPHSTHAVGFIHHGEVEEETDDED